MRTLLAATGAAMLITVGYTVRAWEDSQRPLPLTRIVVPQPTSYYNAGLRISASECREICKVRDRMEKIKPKEEKK